MTCNEGKGAWVGSMVDVGRMVGVDKFGVGRSGVGIGLVGVGLSLVSGVVGAGVGRSFDWEQPIAIKAMNRREGRQFFIRGQVENRLFIGDHNPSIILPEGYVRFIFNPPSL
jgi:hypothetical protein